MKWKNLTDKCKNCQWLHIFSLFMDGDHEYSCGHDPNCMRENGWFRKASTTETIEITGVIKENANDI